MDLTEGIRIDSPRSELEHEYALQFLHERGVNVKPLDDLRMLIHRNTSGSVNAVVAFHRWCHKTASLSVAADREFWLDRPLIHACVHYAFRVCELMALHAQISSVNDRSLRTAKHIGWREVHRIKGGWSDGTDMVFLELLPSDVISTENLH